MALYYASASGHSLSDELHSLRVGVNSLSVSEIFEHKRKNTFQNTKINEYR